MAPAAEAQIDAVVPQALAHQALAYAGFDHEVDRGLLEHAGAHAAFNVFAAARLQDDGFDSLEMQEMREHQAGWAGSDDADLCAHPAFSGSRLSAANIRR